MNTIDPTAHPSDHIDHAQAMIRFLSVTLGEVKPHAGMDDRALEGLCYILNHVETVLDQALIGL